MDTKNIKVLFDKETIENKITEIAKEIDKDYQGKEVVVVAILKGALFFGIDLIKKMETPVILDTIHASSYVGTESSGKLIIRDDISVDLKGKDVIIVEDIIDTGNTLNKIRAHLLDQNPNSLKIAVLVDKKERRTTEVPLDYIGFTIPDKFIIGYGFDIDEKYRNLPYVGYLDV